MSSPIGRSLIALAPSLIREPASYEDEQAVRPTSTRTYQLADPSRPLKYPQATPGSKSSLTASLAKMSLSTKASPPGKKYASGVFQGPTRAPEAGFNEEKMHAIFSSCADAVALEKKAAKMGFRYVGDTGSQSKANTNFKTKAIKINAALSAEQAALSFAYELANASQHDGSQLGPVQRLKNSSPTAEHYAESVLRLESRSVLKRSQVAIAIGLEDLVVNPKYNQFAKDEHLTELEKIDAILSEMMTNGRVNRGQDSAFDHYVKQYRGFHSNRME